MMNRYQGLNSQALRRLIVSPDIPNPNLGIDLAAVHQGIDFDYFPPAQKAPTMSEPTSIEEVTTDGTGNPVNVKMFPNTGYYGDMLGNLGGDY